MFNDPIIISTSKGFNLFSLLSRNHPDLCAIGFSSKVEKTIWDHFAYFCLLIFHVD